MPNQQLIDKKWQSSNELFNDAIKPKSVSIDDLSDKERKFLDNIEKRPFEDGYQKKLVGRVGSYEELMSNVQAELNRRSEERECQLFRIKPLSYSRRKSIQLSQAVKSILVRLVQLPKYLYLAVKAKMKSKSK